MVSILLHTMGAAQVRRDISLNDHWYTIATQNDSLLPADMYQHPVDAAWKRVDVPHNWDSYEGYRRLLHGNRHGDSWYKKQLQVKKEKGKKYFLFFEGVGSFATVFVNGHNVGAHAGGRTSFTIDITEALFEKATINEIAVRALHPSHINDLPWICGGCSDERGFSEGSQPMGIFRPVHLIITHEVRTEPFGVHAWSKLNNRYDSAALHITTQIKNYAVRGKNIRLVTSLVAANGGIQKVKETKIYLKENIVTPVAQQALVLHPKLWSPGAPNLYTLRTQIFDGLQLIDETSTTIGFRKLEWKTATHQLLVNGKAVFINGIAEYEHQLGQSHAFEKEEIISRFKWIKAAGFNALRDAHQPHNLLYGKLCDELGLLWWTQLSAHVWFYTPEFKNNFLQLLRDWVVERRNDPSVILWGLQNESKLPEAFAATCTQLIRELDPTASTERLVTTCNGGSGTDWDVPQNWTGTYGGDPATYASDLKKQVLVGEYGAWRMLGLHSEGSFAQNGPLSEDRMTELMETKLRLGESVKDSSAGHFFWLFNSHDNPGRVQGGEGLRELDRIGPVNYKGMLTPWEEPLDVFYMYRSNYASKEKQPMVYLPMHTWPTRWPTAGTKDSIIVYANCDEVELWNGNVFLGRKKRGGIGDHFQWDGVPIRYNRLKAIGFVNGKKVAADSVQLFYLPPAPQTKKILSSMLAPAKGYQYVYRVNCGGPQYTDHLQHTWQADRALLYNNDSKQNPHWGSVSWASMYQGINPYFASQRNTYNNISGTQDAPLFQTFRYGKEALQYHFPLPDGAYLVELYFTEPWLGTSGYDAGGMRLFDIAMNGKTVIKNLDIWREAGTCGALKKEVLVTVRGGALDIYFPKTASGQAIICAIAVASKTKVKAAVPDLVFSQLNVKNIEAATWLDEGELIHPNTNEAIYKLPSNLFGADWLKTPADYSGHISFIPEIGTDIFIGWNGQGAQPQWLQNFEATKSFVQTTSTKYGLYKKRFAAKEPVHLDLGKGMLVFMQPATAMQPAYDLKPVTSYKAAVVKNLNGATKEQANGREAIVIKSAEASASIEFQTGVADIYSLTLKYYYPGEQTVRGTVQIFDAGNNMMMEQAVEFTFTRSGKWNTVSFNTGTQINAGNYTLKLLVKEGEGLAVSGVDLQ